MLDDKPTAARLAFECLATALEHRDGTAGARARARLGAARLVQPCPLDELELQRLEQAAKQP